MQEIKGKLDGQCWPLFGVCEPSAREVRRGISFGGAGEDHCVENTDYWGCRWTWDHGPSRGTLLTSSQGPVSCWLLHSDQVPEDMRAWHNQCSATPQGLRELMGWADRGHPALPTQTLAHEQNQCGSGMGGTGWGDGTSQAKSHHRQWGWGRGPGDGELYPKTGRSAGHAKPGASSTPEL